MNGGSRRRTPSHNGWRERPYAASSMLAVAIAQVLIESPHDGTGNYPAFVDNTRTFSRPGAQALRVHFANIELAPGGMCDDPNCDNIYLTDGAGDLYQIFSQAQNGPRTSVQIPGDTVNIRIVSDRTSQAAGYVVDRIESMGGTVAVEIKRRGEIDGVEQLTRYLELMNRDPHLAPVTGVYAAQVIKPQARTLAEDRGIRCVVLDYDALKGIDNSEHRLF